MADPEGKEWNSEAYDRLSDPQRNWGMKVLARLPLRGDETVMDAGCGTGRLTAELLEALPRGRVVAVDLSENMLQKARENLARYGGRVAFVHADWAVCRSRRSSTASSARLHFIGSKITPPCSVGCSAH